jgi:hypothetical protein
MKLVVIFGPPAVGKMTVGHELEKLSGLKLFHNHMSLELVNNFFDFGSPQLRRLDKKIRFAIFEEVAQSDLKGLIFTIVLAFNYQEDLDYLNDIVAIFEAQAAEVCLVELKADLPERLKRNKQETRLQHKPSKRNLEISEKNLLQSDEMYRMHTIDNELANWPLLKIDNTDIGPQEVAERIVAFFSLDKNDEP